MTHKYIGPMFFILSAELSKLSRHTNFHRSWDLQDELERDDLNYLIADGVWDGHREQSFLVFIEDFDTIKRLADTFDQEAFIRVNPNRSMELFSPHRTYIGEWTEIPYKPSGNHTIVDGRYFQSVYFTSGAI